MRALLGMVLFSMVGCDALWASYVGMGDFGTGGDMATCAEPGSCDMASGELPDADLPDSSTPPDGPVIPPCTADNMCMTAQNPVCDLNTNTCVATKSTAPFVDSPTESIPLANQYMLMASGDYNNDGMGDVAVTGVFPSVGANASVNATTATAVPVEIYRGTGDGGLVKDANCPLPGGQVPVQLLTIPGTPKELLVATSGANIYRCSKASGTWQATLVTLSAPPLTDGFKQLALVTNPASSADLAVRTSGSLFPDGSTGYLEIRRGTAANSYGGFKILISNSNVTWVAPYRPGNTTFDLIATTWDGISTHAGIEFHTIGQFSNMEQNLGSGSTGVGNTPGSKFTELGGSSPYATVTSFRIAGQANPGILFGYSQAPNTLTVFYGDSMTNTVQHGQKTLTPEGLMQAFAGDANGDMQDEIGIYTIGLNKTAKPRHLQLLAYNANMIKDPMYDFQLDTENFRGMALETLGNVSDRRTVAKRKDLIALVEDPTGKKSRLVVRRANLNYLGGF